MGTYIIHFDDKPWEDLDDELYYRCFEIPWFSTTKTTISRLTPYIEDSAYAHGYTEAESKYRKIRDELEKQAYQRGYETAKHEYEDCTKPLDNGKSYQQGLTDAWEAARTLWNTPNRKEIFGHTAFITALTTLTAQETIEKIRQYEQEQEQKESEEPKKEQSFTAEEVMRQYLDTFCNRHFCSTCPLHTSEFTCGRGYHFTTKNPISNEEVRRAYAKVLQHEEVG